MRFKARTLIHPIALLLIPVQFAQADELVQPPCDELVEWTSSIDADDRWQPFAENPRVWLPRAMASPGFERLFGKPALEWTHEDVVAARGYWSGCIQAARKSRDRARQTALAEARRYLTANLRDAVNYRARRPAQASDPAAEATAQPRPQRQVPASSRPAPDRPASPAAAERQVLHPGVDRALRELIAQPPSYEAFRALGALSRLDPADAAALQALQRRFGSLPGHRATSAAYTLLRELQSRGSAGFEEAARPRIDARLAEVKPPVLDALREEFSQSPADPNRLRALGRRYEAVMAELEGLMPEDEWRALADETRARRRAVVSEALEAAKVEIDRVPVDGNGVAAIDGIIRRTQARGLDAGQNRALLAHARARQQAIADRIVKAAIDDGLPSIPETWAGFAALDALNQRTSQQAGGRASAQVKAAYLAAVKARMAQIGRRALPEYRDRLSRLPEDEAGLEQAEKNLADLDAWQLMDEAVRADYRALAQSRRDQIAGVVEAARAERRALDARERRLAISAGGDPRFVGTRWIGAEGAMALDFRDQEMVLVNALGFKFAGSYKVSRDDVVITGPHGQLVYTLRDGRLVGNGASFTRQPD